MLKIYQIFNPEEEKILKKISLDLSVEEIHSDNFKKQVKDISFFLNKQNDGVALSAPQIGINKRFFVIAKKVFDNLNRKDIDYNDLVIINPKITNYSKKKNIQEEGCFSVRWYYGDVERYKNITVEALNLKGEKKHWGLSDFLARIFQHEIDHLDGILFIDKAKNIHKISEKEINRIQSSE